mmetsp:Transcript_16712/g.44997  ORF Transcript_16712/g.44997 Transcript_16712/m.44997 type:complete len:231 (-) Transcript_16712:277-969(-)
MAPLWNDCIHEHGLYGTHRHPQILSRPARGHPRAVLPGSSAGLHSGSCHVLRNRAGLARHVWHARPRSRAHGIRTRGCAGQGIAGTRGRGGHELLHAVLPRSQERPRGAHRAALGTGICAPGFACAHCPRTSRHSAQSTGNAHPGGRQPQRYRASLRNRHRARHLWGGQPPLHHVTPRGSAGYSSDLHTACRHWLEPQRSGCTSSHSRVPLGSPWCHSHERSVSDESAAP